MAQRNSFINGIELTEANSLIHLLTGMGSNHPFKLFQQIDFKSQMTYKSLDHDFRLRITLNVFDP